MSETQPAPEGQAGEGVTGVTEEQVQSGEQQGAWYTGLPDGLRAYAETKGWKGPDAVVESYKNLEKLRGVPAERLVSLPEDPSDPDAMAPVYAKLGRPDTPESYTNALGESMADDFWKEAAGAAHKAGLGDRQFQAMQSWFAEASQKIAEQRQKEVDGAFQDWRAANPQAEEGVKRLLTAVGVDEDRMTQLLEGDKATLFDTLGRIAARTQEQEVVQGEGAGMMSPAAAQQKISELFGDKAFMERYTSRDQKVRSSAVTQMNKLHEIAGRGR